MNQEYMEQLSQLYPSIFPHGVDESLVSCGDGWFHIVDSLCGRITNYLAMHFNVPNVEVVQIKEKFATLRFYIDGGDDKIYDMINDAEEQSGVTCELTGELGTLHRRGHWLRTLSKEKAEELGYESLEGRGEVSPFISLVTTNISQNIKTYNDTTIDTKRQTKR